MSYRLRRLVALFLRCLCLPCCAVDASESLADAGPQTLTALFENDLFGDSDQQYTNGFKLNWMSPNLKALGDAPAVPRWLLHAVHGLNAFEHALLGDTERAFNLGFAAGQLIFTPGDTQAVQVVDEDRVKDPLLLCEFAPFKFYWVSDYWLAEDEV